MATAHLIGDARFTFTPPGGSLTTHKLAIPLWRLSPVDNQPRYVFESADLTARHIVTIGTGVREIWATIRMDNEPGNLRIMLRAGLQQDVTLTYYRTESGTAYPAKLVEVEGGEVVLTPDRDRYGMGEWEARIRLRRVDGNNFDGLLT